MGDNLGIKMKAWEFSPDLSQMYHVPKSLGLSVPQVLLCTKGARALPQLTLCIKDCELVTYHSPEKYLHRYTSS